MKTILNYFFRGMLIVFPLGATIYLVAVTLNWMNDTFNELLFGWFDYDIPGLGILAGFFMIALTGFIFTRAFTRPFFQFFEDLFVRAPIISIIYTSLRDLAEAFVGDRKKFTQPVKVRMNENGVYRLGFITEQDLSKLGFETDVAVYLPHSYNVSGNLYIFPAADVIALDTEPANFMRFIVSGGVTGFDAPEKSIR